MKKTCKAITIKGKPCKNKVSDSDYCHVHKHHNKVTKQKSKTPSPSPTNPKQSPTPKQSPNPTNPKQTIQPSLDQHLQLLNSCKKLSTFIASEDIDSIIKKWKKEQQDAIKMVLFGLSHIANNVSIIIIHDSTLSSQFISKLIQAINFIHKLVHNKAYKPLLTKTEVESKIWRYIHTFYQQLKKTWPTIKQISYISFNVLAYCSSMYYTIGHFMYIFSQTRLLGAQNDLVVSTIKASIHMITTFKNNPSSILFLIYIFTQNSYFRTFLYRVASLIGFTLDLPYMKELIMITFGSKYIPSFFKNQLITTGRILTQQETKQQVTINPTEKKIHGIVYGFADAITAVSKGYKSNIDKEMSIQELKDIYHYYQKHILSSRILMNQFGDTTGVILRDIHEFISKHNIHVCFSSILLFVSILGCIWKYNKFSKNKVELAEQIGNRNQEIGVMIENFKFTQKALKENDIDLLLSNLTSCIDGNNVDDCNKVIHFF